MAYTGKERVLAALNHEIPDRVPTFEWQVDKKVVDVLEPGFTVNDFFEKHLDAMMVELDYDKKEIEPGKTQNEWGIIQTYTGEAHGYPIDGLIHNREELEAFVPPAFNKPGRCASIKAMLEKYGDEKAVILHLNDIWSLPSRMMSFNDFIMMIMDEPELVSDIVKMTVDTQIGLAKEAADCGIKFIYTGDDVAYNSGPMISPDMFREIFFPELKRIIGAYKDLGFYVMKHTDGNIMSLLDMYVEAGIDLIDPIDPIAGMDLGVIKNKYGKKIAIKGNVNCATTLVYGSIDDTVAETKQRLETGMPGGGYIISSSNTIHSSVNPENYRAMLDTIEKYGKY